MSDAEPCGGPGTCHGCMQWCDRCGDVDLMCDASPDGCDVHRCGRCKRRLRKADVEHEYGELYKECLDCLMQSPLDEEHPAWVRFCEWFVCETATWLKSGTGPNDWTKVGPGTARVVSTSDEALTTWTDDKLEEAFASTELVLQVVEAHGVHRSLLAWNTAAGTAGPAPARIALAADGRPPSGWSTPRFTAGAWRHSARDQMFKEGLALLIQRFGAELERRRTGRARCAVDGCFDAATYTCSSARPTCARHRSVCCTPICDPHKPPETG